MRTHASHSVKRAAALALASGILLTGSASALFGRKTPDVEEGAPTARDTEIRTYTGIPCESQFQASDSEGDDMTFALGKEPKKGTVEINGANFTYTPKEGASGNDRFTYTATDSAGHSSAPATVTVTIEKTRSGVTYADTDAASALAAQQLAEKGTFTGSKIGGTWRFEPDRAVTRGEFLAMALETAGREVTPVTRTGFSDDAAIPTWAKAYAAAGVSDGVILGKPSEEGASFQCGEPISFNEAAAVLDRVLDLGDVDLDVWYAGRDAAPSWAAQAVGNLEAFQILEAGSFGSQTLERPVTRADAARMLCAVDTLLTGDGSSASAGWMR